MIGLWLLAVKCMPLNCWPKVYKLNWHLETLSNGKQMKFPLDRTEKGGEREKPNGIRSFVENIYSVTFEYHAVCGVVTMVLISIPSKTILWPMTTNWKIFAQMNYLNYGLINPLMWLNLQVNCQTRLDSTPISTLTAAGDYYRQKLSKSFRCTCKSRLVLTTTTNTTTRASNS